MSGIRISGLAWVLLGGILNGSFVLPMKRTPGWRWENIWLPYSLVGMIVIPWGFAIATVPHLGDVYRHTSWSVLIKVMFFGFGWGIGSTLFGLGIDRVGMALGYSIVLGITASFGSLLPLGILHPERLLTREGYVLIAGMALVVLGLIFLSIAGQRRERERRNPTSQSTRSEFTLGMLICALSGIFSAMLNFSFVFGKELQDRSLGSVGTAMSANPVWSLALSAGFLANAGYCGYLLSRNRTWHLFFQSETVAYSSGAFTMGLLWFGGIAAYGVGAATLGPLGGVIGWPLLMAMTIIAANVWGTVTGEWTGASHRSYAYLWVGLAVLVLAICVISVGGRT